MNSQVVCTVSLLLLLLMLCSANELFDLTSLRGGGMVVPEAAPAVDAQVLGNGGGGGGGGAAFLGDRGFTSTTRTY